MVVLETKGVDPVEHINQIYIMLGDIGKRLVDIDTRMAILDRNSRITANEIVAVRKLAQEANKIQDDISLSDLS